MGKGIDGWWKLILGAISCLAPLAHAPAASFLFDNTKAETAGNADWVIDEDANVAARLPTPPASGITSATTRGLLARRAFFLGRGARAARPHRGDLAGGRLFLISDHNGSDRNNDGADSVRVWNDLIDANGVQSEPFGFRYNVNKVSLTSSLVNSDAADPLIHGPAGAVTGLKYSAGATMTIHPATHPDVHAAVWRTAGSDANVMAVYGGAGRGRFVALGDSSPPDDGTGTPGNTLYPGWTELASHAFLVLNGSIWLTQGLAPTNDAFANASVVPNPEGNINLAGTNLAATRETGEPSHAGNSGGKSVWWKWIAPSSASYTVATTGSSFDTTLGVYTGSAVNALQTIASNDDAGGRNQSLVTFTATAGTIYRIAVDGYSAASGSIALQITEAAPLPPPPGNDAFSEAEGLAGDAPTATANNASATAETGEPKHAGYTANHSVWWTWTAPADGYASVSTAGSSFDTILAVYTGSSLGALTAIAGNDDANSTTQSQVSFAVTANTTYAIAVDSYSSSGTGSIALAINGALPAPIVSIQRVADAAERPLAAGSFSVSLSIAQPRATSVNIRLDGTASPGADFTASLPIQDRTLTVTFAPLQTSASVSLTPIPDANPLEFDETIVPTLPSGALATILLHDDTPYDAAWAAAAGAGFTLANADPAIDADADGVPNLLEYALGGNPVLADEAAILPVSGVGDYPDSGGITRRYATLTFLRRLSSTLTYTALASSNLQSWSAAGVVQAGSTTTGAPAGFERVTWRASTPLDQSATTFLRLQVSRP